APSRPAGRSSAAVHRRLMGRGGAGLAGGARAARAGRGVPALDRPGLRAWWRRQYLRARDPRRRIRRRGTAGQRPHRPAARLPAGQLADAIRYGHWFDGSALEAGGRTMETDLLLRPDLSTWGILPWSGAREQRTGRVICDVQTPEGEPFPADPRAVLGRALLE